MVAAAAEAEQLMAENSHLLDPIREISSAESHGKECPSGDGRTEYASPQDLISEIVAEELNMGFWEDTVNELNMIEQGGIYNVAKLSHWLGKPEKESGLITSYRPIFNNELYKAHVARQDKERCKLNLKSEKQTKQKAQRIAGKLTAMQRRVQAAEARAARKAK